MNLNDKSVKIAGKTYIRFENTSKYVDTLSLFSKKLEPKVIDP